MGELISQGGPFAVLAAGLGALSCLLSVALIAGAVFGARTEIVRALAVMCVIFSVTTSTAGIGGALIGRQRSDQAAAASRPSAAERIRRAGYLESRANLKVALPFAAPAAAVAIAGMVIATRRRQREDDDRSPSGVGLSVALMLLAVGVWIFGARLLLQRLPGRELDDAGWKVLELSDALNAGEWDKCFTTPWSLGAATPAHALPAHAENQKRCAEHFTEVVDLTRLQGAQWIDDASVKELIAKRLAPPPPPPSPTPAPPDKNEPPSTDPGTPATPDPALAMLESKLRHCIKKHAKLELEVNISKDGKVDLPKKSAKCLKLAVAKLKLPGPARKLEVEIK